MEIFEDSVWQMSLGERAAFEGFLAQVRPQLAIEIGTAEGASLTRIARHAREVHSFDLVAPSLELPPNVTLHTGDSHVELPRLLAELAAQGRNVDFVLVDGDHSEEGVRRDIEDLLDSDALRSSVILIHDINNEQVRRGVDAVRFGEWRKVVMVELDCVPGYLFKEEALKNELWGGLGMILVDESRPVVAGKPVLQDRYHAAAPIFAHMRDILVAQDEDRLAERTGELADLRARVDELSASATLAHQRARHEIALREALQRSISWRVTKPLRQAKARLRGNGA